MSGLTLKLTVMSHDKSALENMLDYRIVDEELKGRRVLYGDQRDTFRSKSFFAGYDIIRTCPDAPYLYYVESPEHYPLDRTYYTTILYMAEALNGQGIIYAKGFDDGSGTYGRILYGWNEIRSYGAAANDSCMLARERMRINSDCKSYDVLQLSDYYSKNAPPVLRSTLQKLKEEYEKAEEARRLEMNKRVEEIGIQREALNEKYKKQLAELDV